MEQTLIIELTLIWLSFWGIYNYILVPAGKSSYKGPLHSGFVFIIFSFLSTYSAFDKDIVGLMPFYTLFILSVLIIYPYSKKVTGVFLNSLFQMTWWYSFIVVTGPNEFLLGLIFFIYHIPILLLEQLNLKVKLLLLFLSLIGGLTLASLLVYLPFPYSILIAIVLHFITYLLFLYPLDRKHKLGIIN